MSSHLSAQANSSTLGFIAEECALFLSDKSPPRDGIASLGPVDLRRDYIRVIDLGLFELSLRTNDKKCNISPHFDLRASNDTVHIRTCSDSARALMQLLTYFASDGDLQTPSDTSSSIGSSHCSPLHKSNESQLIDVDHPQEVNNLSSSQKQQISDLLGDAMKETVSDEEEVGVFTNDGAKLFFFPDENAAFHDMGKPIPQLAVDLGDMANRSSDTDDEFIIIGDEGGNLVCPHFIKNFVSNYFL